MAVFWRALARRGALGARSTRSLASFVLVAFGAWLATELR